MVFEPSSVPAGRSQFLAWFRAQTEWTEGHDYNDPVVCSPALKDWFFDIKSKFPAMNGPQADGDIDDPHVTDYSFGTTVIYAAFAWSVAREAHAAVFERAKTHGVGFFDVSSPNGEVWMPHAGIYSIVHQEGAA